MLAWITTSVSEKLCVGIVYSTDARSVWLDQKERFEMINGSRIFSLCKYISLLTQGTYFSIYNNKLKSLWDNNDLLVTLPSFACETSKEYVKHNGKQKLVW